MEKLGLGYDVLREINPGIIYAAVSGFGQYGPYAKRPGYDIISQAMSGLMSTTGWPGGAPTRSGTAMGDVLGGLSVTIGILSAIYNRSHTGLGQMVDVALVDSAVASLEIIKLKGQIQLLQMDKEMLRQNLATVTSMVEDLRRDAEEAKDKVHKLRHDIDWYGERR